MHTGMCVGVCLCRSEGVCIGGKTVSMYMTECLGEPCAGEGSQGSWMVRSRYQGLRYAKAQIPGPQPPCKPAGPELVLE